MSLRETSQSSNRNLYSSENLSILWTRRFICFLPKDHPVCVALLLSSSCLHALIIYACRFCHRIATMSALVWAVKVKLLFLSCFFPTLFFKQDLWIILVIFRIPMQSLSYVKALFLLFVVDTLFIMQDRIWTIVFTYAVSLKTLDLTSVAVLYFLKHKIM